MTQKDIEMRLASLEKHKAGSDRIASVVSATGVLMLTGVVAGVIMLVTTNQQTGQNTDRIETIDNRQRSMQITQGEHGHALKRIELYLSHQ